MVEDLGLEMLDGLEEAEGDCRDRRADHRGEAEHHQVTAVAGQGQRIGGIRARTVVGLPRGGRLVCGGHREPRESRTSSRAAGIGRLLAVPGGAERFERRPGGR